MYDTTIEKGQYLYCEQGEGEGSPVIHSDSLVSTFSSCTWPTLGKGVRRLVGR